MGKVAATEVTRLLPAPSDFIHRVSPQQRGSVALSYPSLHQVSRLAGTEGPQFDRRSNSIPLPHIFTYKIPSLLCGGEVEQTQIRSQFGQAIAGLFKLSTASGGRSVRPERSVPVLTRYRPGFPSCPQVPAEGGDEPRSVPVGVLAEQGSRATTSSIGGLRCPAAGGLCARGQPPAKADDCTDHLDRVSCRAIGTDKQILMGRELLFPGAVYKRLQMG